MNRLIASTMVAGAIAVGGLAVAGTAPMTSVGAQRTATAEASPRGNHPILRTVVTTAAEALGISPRELAIDLRTGQSIAEVASERGMEIEVVADALTTKATTAIDAAEANGRIDEERAAQRKERLPEVIDRLLHFRKGDRPDRPDRPGAG